MATNNWLQGRHALITGGGTGIGAAAATHLHAAGAKVSLLGRRLRAARAGRRESSPARPSPATSPTATRSSRAFDEARAANGPIDL